MPEGIELLSGRIGYDPESGQMIFFGRNHEYPKENDETYAYDGTTWAEVHTTSHPPQIHYSQIAGMVYHPLLHGLVAITSSLEIGDSETWIYKNGDWQKIDVLEQSSARIDHAVCYSPNSETVILSGGTASDFAIDTWKMLSVIHSKPVSKPDGR
jgi:hypothetical protein